LTTLDEKAEYDKHQNDPRDSGYRRFLARSLTPLLDRVHHNTEAIDEIIGLDFGCGPGPTIEPMAAEQGVKVINYDLYYCNTPHVLERQYNFITLTEVIEHIASPSSLLPVLNKCLKQKGHLLFMTKRLIDIKAFSQWHYKNDPTHICFYADETFRWIAQHFNWHLEVVDKDVVIFTKGVA